MIKREPPSKMHVTNYLTPIEKTELTVLQNTRKQRATSGCKVIHKMGATTTKALPTHGFFCQIGRFGLYKM